MGKAIVKVILAVLAVMVFDTILGAFLCGGLFRWVYELEPTNVWKPMEGPPSHLYFIGYAVLSLILVLVYMLLKKGLPGNRVVKGLIFGLCVWAVGTLPGMWATYSFMTVATGAVIFITVYELIFSPIRGIIIASICGK